MGKGKEIYRKNIIELDDYFAYSGKIEINGKFTSNFEEYNYNRNTFINNDMSKYVLKDYKKIKTKIK